MMERPISAAQWKEMEALFEEASLLGKEEWPAFLASRCGNDSDLAARLLQLLAADREANDFLAGKANVEVTALATPVLSAKLPLHQMLCDRFEVVAYLGEGGMGQVYETIDRALDQRIAIKTIRPEIAGIPGVLSHFKREVYTARRITHPNVCRTFDLEQHVPSAQVAGGAEITFLTMELLRGHSLAERLRQSGSIPSEEVHPIGLQLASALRAAHEAGVIHCDLKPSNVFLVGRGETLRVVVTDFGIARILHLEDHSLLLPTQRGAASQEAPAGTPAYMAPEQFERGQCTEASDIYSFGLVLFEALAGHRLHPHSRTEEQIHHRLKGLTTKEGFSWSSFLSRCLQAEPEARFAKMQDVLAGLEGRHQLSLVHRPPSAALLPVAEPNRLRGWKGATKSTLGGYKVWVVVLLMAAVVAAPLVWMLRSSAAHVSRPSVAILPFDNLGGEPELASLGNKLTAKVTIDLARFIGIDFTSQAALSGLGSHPDLRTLRERLHVDTVLSGSLTKTAQGPQLQVALMDANNGAQRWGQTYSLSEDDVAAAAQDIAVDLTYVLRRGLQDGHAAIAPESQTSVPAAQDAYRRGEARLAENRDRGSEAAAEDFQQAIDADQNFAAAYERVANCNLFMANSYLPPERTTYLLDRAEKFALKSVELRESGAAFMDLARVQVLRFDWKRAEENAERSVELEPGNTFNHAAFAFYVLMPQGRFAEARSQFDYAARVPTKNLTNEYREAIGEYFARHFQVSLEKARDVKQKYPSNETINEVIASDYIGMNDFSTAEEFLRGTTPQTEEWKLARAALLGVVLARSGRKPEARQILTKLDAEEKPTFGLNFQLAALSAALGDRTRASEYLKKSQETRETSVLFVGVDTLMDPLRHDPRFQRMLLEMNLKSSI